MADMEGDFQQTLAEIGLEQYYEQFVAEAFDSWAVLSQITESDLDALGVKRGHRRTLQMAIADYQRQTDSRPQSERSMESRETATPTEDVPRVKRKYVRHPKRDACAPEKALTGYVLFANYTREQLKDEKLGFQEIAKIVGARWRVLPKDEKAVFLRRSKELKDAASNKMNEYKRTSEYRDYQRYLVDFKAAQMGIAPSKRAYPDAEDQLDRRTRRSLSAELPQHHQQQHQQNQQNQQQSTTSMIDVSAGRAGYFAPVQSPTLLQPMLNMAPLAYGSARHQASSPQQAAYRPAVVPSFHESFAMRQLPPLQQVTGPYERRS